WIFYGPIENVRMAFAGCAMTDIFITEAAMDLGTEPQTEDHPYYKLL
ncbi:MAG: tetrahydromethanopterin S-methyltransferase subunit H, partial [Methanobacteriales archaeon]|nr:tetrahydromethanopterin S-methyltransferase subunit H [Methanobacteriales archaeon]MBC7119773.1 tetrahydromethanopterin S-methyltransferase subunit H [Methanobacteriaceae archaeon]